MKHSGFWQALRRYLWEHRLLLLVFLLFGAIFAGVFSLYRLELEAVLYAAGLCLLAGGVIAAFCFIRTYRRHRELDRLRQRITLLADRLPESKGLLEDDYQGMLADLQEDSRAARTAFESQRRESIDYYTTWVHQIKTPISVMRMILQEEDTPEHQELLAELFRIEQYVEMVLCYFRLDSASSDFVFREVPLDPIIKQAVRKYAGQFVRRRIRLDYRGTDVRVLTDEKWLGFILEQLLSNAVKYTQKGTVTISVEGRRLHVSDTGIGIAPEDLPRIFEKGFTGYNGRADKKSTGLGLYLCRQAADKLSHRLSVTSEVGAGTTFTIDLSTADLEVE